MPSANQEIGVPGFQQQVPTSTSEFRLKSIQRLQVDLQAEVDLPQIGNSRVERAFCIRRRPALEAYPTLTINNSTRPSRVGTDPCDILFVEVAARNHSCGASARAEKADELEGDGKNLA